MLDALIGCILRARQKSQCADWRMAVILASLSFLTSKEATRAIKLDKYHTL